MRTFSWFSTRRLAAHGTIALIVATATAAGVAFADSSGGHPAGAKAPVSNGGSRASAAIAQGVRTALDRLVASGTIDQAQANVIEQHAVAGSVDPQALVAAGTLTQAEMQAVASALDEVKLSLAAASGGRPAGAIKAASPDNGNRAPAAIARGARTALQTLVANGTLDQAQADTIEHDVQAGLVDSHALLTAGTVNQAQMRAVTEVLGQVKRSVAASRP